MPRNKQSLPVFFDGDGNRWRKVRRLLGAFSIFFVVLFLVLAYSLIQTPSVPGVKIKSTSNTAYASSNNGTPSWASDNASQSSGSEKTRFVQKRNQVKIAKAPLVAASTTNKKPISVGFYVNWDNRSFTSLKRNLPKLDWVVPEWIRLSDGADSLTKDFDQQALT